MLAKSRGRECSEDQGPEPDKSTARWFLSSPTWLRFLCRGAQSLTLKSSLLPNMLGPMDDSGLGHRKNTMSLEHLTELERKYSTPPWGRYHVSAVHNLSTAFY